MSVEVTDLEDERDRVAKQALDAKEGNLPIHLRKDPTRMDSAEAATVRLGDILEVGENWPRQGNTALEDKVEVYGIEPDDHSQTGRCFWVRDSQGRTRRLDAGWFKTKLDVIE